MDKNNKKIKSEGQRRILLLLDYLYQYASEQTPVTVSDILHHWEEHGIHTDRKSVYGDISTLTELGVDIVSTRGLQNTYFIASRLFEMPELKLLADAVASSHFVTSKKSTTLLSKLARLTSADQAEQLERPIYLEGSVKPENETIYYSMDTIQAAIQEKQQISFQYYEYTPQKEKVLKHDGYRYRFSPYALIWHRDFYYAVGWSEKHGKLAQFRVERMVDVRLTKQPSVPADDFDPVSYVRQVFGMYDGDRQEVTLLCENSVMRSVIDRFGESVKTEVVDDGHFRAVAEVALTPPFFAWVFTFGGKIRIIGPKDVLAKMRKMAAWLY